MYTRRFCYRDGKTDKFWEISIEGSCHTVRYGRTGTNGQSQTKEFASETAAQAAAEKLIQEKIRKGYVEEGGDAAEPALPGSVGASSIPSSPLKSPAAAPQSETAAGATAEEAAETSREIRPAAVAATPDLSQLDPDLPRSLDLEPHFWFRATWRDCPPLNREAPLPFHPKEAAERLRQVTTSNYGWEWHWEKAQLPLSMTRDEAAFWLAAFMASRSYTTPRSLAKELAKNVPEVRSLREIIAELQDAYWVSGTVMLPLSQLFPPIQIVEELLEQQNVYTSASRASSYFVRSRQRSLQGLAEYIVPYLTPEEREQLREQLRPLLDPRKWPPSDATGRHSPPETAFFLAGLLGLSGDLQRLVDGWPDEAYVGEGQYAILHHQPQEIVLGLGSAEAVEAQMRRLGLRPLTRHQLGAWIAHTEYGSLDLARDAILSEEDRDGAARLVQVLSQVRAPEAAVMMLELMLGSKASAGARRWLEENPVHAVAGLVSVAAGRGRLGEAAAAYLRAVLRKGGEPLLRRALEKAAPETRERVRQSVLEHPESLALPLDLATAPSWLREVLSGSQAGAASAWVTPADLPPLLIGDRRLDDEQTRIALTALAESTPEAPHPLVTAFREHGARDALDRFAWRLFEVWLAEGAPPKERWAMQALGHWGGDPSALKLTPLIRKWPGENQHQRAVIGLDCLRGIGTDTALMLINGIAQKVAFKGIKARAAECMEAIATDRGFTRIQLEDRIVPDCDLDEHGRRTFDFGPRQFEFLLGPGLKPMVREADGKLRPDLPKPGANDDPERSAQALADWKLLKKQVADVTKIQVVRLEQAMVTGRRWTPEEFDTLLVRHPLMTHLVRLIVWGAHDAEGRLTGSFRVTEDRTLADENDELFALTGTAAVGVVHPLELTAEQREAWVEVFNDYELVSPFPQLGRPTFALQADERASREISRFAAIKIPPQTLVFTLEKLGWERGIPQDGGGFYSHTKPFYGLEVTAVIEYEEGLFVGNIAESGEQRITRAFFVPGVRKPEQYSTIKSSLPLAEVHPIAISEVLADLTAVISKVT